MTERGKLKILAAVGLFCLATALVGWGVGVVAAQADQQAGRFQVAAPDLVLDTATGKLTTAQGAVLEQAASPSSKEVGRYTVDGYVTVVTRAVGLNVLNLPFVQQELVKGYVIGDAKTGRVIRQRIYAAQPIGPADLRPE